MTYNSYMKFRIGDETDSSLCVALQHELLRCHEALSEFCAHATRSILLGEDKWLAFKMYNAYSHFVLHLYEFMAGALARDLRNSTIAAANKERTAKVEHFISTQVQRILRNKRRAITNGTAPAWENALSSYPEKAPLEFAKDFRDCRNKVAGHVSYKRTTLNLSDFYDRYHLYLHLLYRDALSSWWPAGTQFPDLKKITDFSVLIRSSRWPRPTEFQVDGGFFAPPKSPRPVNH